jgi:hypothetical protein
MTPCDATIRPLRPDERAAWEPLSKGHMRSAADATGGTYQKPLREGREPRGADALISAKMAGTL